MSLYLHECKSGDLLCTFLKFLVILLLCVNGEQAWSTLKFFLLNIIIEFLCFHWYIYIIIWVGEDCHLFKKVESSLSLTYYPVRLLLWFSYKLKHQHLVTEGKCYTIPYLYLLDHGITSSSILWEVFQQQGRGMTIYLW